MGTDGKQVNKLKKAGTALNTFFLILRAFHLKREFGTENKNNHSFFPDEDRNARRESQGKPPHRMKGVHRDTTGKKEDKDDNDDKKKKTKKQKKGKGKYSRVPELEEKGHEYESLKDLWDDIVGRHKHATEEELHDIMSAWFFRQAWTENEHLSVEELEEQGNAVQG